MASITEPLASRLLAASKHVEACQRAHVSAKADAKAAKEAVDQALIEQQEILRQAREARTAAAGD